MSGQTAENQQYMVNVSPAEGVGGGLFFTFMPKEPKAEHVPGGTLRRLPQFVVAVPGGARELHFDWSKTPDVPEAAAREEIQSEVAARMEERWTWLDRVKALVDQVEQWARELNWSTRRVEKGIDDVRIGKHRVPALLMQEETCRVLFGTLARSTRAPRVWSTSTSCPLTTTSPFSSTTTAAGTCITTWAAARTRSFRRPPPRPCCSPRRPWERS